MKKNKACLEIQPSWDHRVGVVEEFDTNQKAVDRVACLLVLPNSSIDILFIPEQV